MPSLKALDRDLDVAEDFKRALDKFAAERANVNVICGGDSVLSVLVESWRRLHAHKGAKPVLQ